MIIEGWFEIKDDKGNIELVAHNDVLDKGSRWILSAISNTLVADGYPANAAKHIQYGSGTTPVVPSADWHLESFTGDLGAVTVVTKVSDTLISLALTYTTTNNPVYINEMAITLTATNPVSSVNYAHAVIDRCVLAATYIIPPNTTKTITYYMKIKTS
jgi:hypothetical protein